MGDGRILLKPRHDDSFKKVPSNEPNFGRIHLAGQYLQGAAANETKIKDMKFVWGMQAVIQKSN
jgi:hypothetical protein